VVFFHTWKSEAGHLRALAAFLGPDQPLYGIEPPAPDDGAMPESVDDWIAHHRPLFESLPVEPPYLLAGFSFGGVLALELARQLQAEGAQVAWLGLVDTMRPRLNPKGLKRYLRYHLRELRVLQRGYRRGYLKRLVRGGTHRTRLRLKINAYRILRRVHLVHDRPKSLGEAEQMPPLQRSIWRSYLTYEAAPYDKPVALFTSTGNRVMAWGDPNLRWTKVLTGGLDVTRVQGEHMELFAPENIHSVGNAIRDSLARSQGISSTRPNASRLSR
jgi:thioesterase domain-containing protein